jgi:hypothetical protein
VLVVSVVSVVSVVAVRARPCPFVPVRAPPPLSPWRFFLVNGVPLRRRVKQTLSKERALAVETECTELERLPWPHAHCSSF